MKKPLIICGVTDMEGNAVKKTKEEQEAFIKMMSNNGEYDVIFDETNGTLKLMNGLVKVPLSN